MTFLLLILLAGQQTSSENLWKLRAGCDLPGNPVEMGSFLYSRVNNVVTGGIAYDNLLAGIVGGDRSLLIPLVSMLVSSGNTELAEVYWRLGGLELPATRNDLLNALAWYGRFDLYREMALNPVVPPDMEGTIHADQCGAVCAMGWMRTRRDGLFHGEELVLPMDIQILSLSFPFVDNTLEYIPVSSLESIFQAPRGVQP